MHTTTDLKEQLEILITSGGDERIRLLPDTGRNKYLLSPIDYKGLLCRSSCTCNTLNDNTYKAIQSTFQWYQNVGYSRVLSNQIDRLYTLLSKDYHNEFDIMITPSGSDLAYVPLLMANVLHPGQKIKSFITCPEELGSGSILAMSGKYFYEFDKYGIQREKGSSIFENLDIETFKFPARDEDGQIVDHQEDILQKISTFPHHAKLGHLVVGSKSGIEDNLDIIEKCKDDVIWTVDLCQLRNPSKLIHQLLDWNAMIMITGSKFYQAPPFCGLMLIPKSISKRISQYRGEVDPGFQNVFSRYNLPLSWSHMRSQFKPFENVGLLLRWEAAIVEMEAFDKIPSHISLSLIDEWHDFIQDRIQQLSNLELMPHQEHTNNSIVSFRVKKDNDYLDYDNLKQIYDQCMLGVYPEMEGGYERFSIGQPVRYGDKAFLRIALGSFDMRNLLETRDFRNDAFILKTVSEMAKV